ncbi:DUF4430 domain-containing protein [Streptococcus orisratti]|uniref:DUF4430 domain-containing protein n=1 Tax=Streptococcus TaxID=1301 RepID=UPI00037A38DE|nr:DUF4430 domain-containing protein [Streptococcus orisratti]MCI7678329.1 DUF4430 domain-containing protein [Streptococcus orisratti]
MKKTLSLLALLLSVLFLTACGNSTADSTKTSQSSSAGTVRLIVKEGDNTTDEKVSFQKGDTVMDVLKANYKVKESKGFITVIDGVAQDEEKGLYWMFDVNDELAPKTANKIKVKDGDKIEFYQSVYKG